MPPLRTGFAGGDGSGTRVPAVDRSTFPPADSALRKPLLHLPTMTKPAKAGLSPEKDVLPGSVNAPTYGVPEASLWSEV
jgi:hypothetical protein